MHAGLPERQLNSTQKLFMQTELLSHFELVSVALTFYFNLLLKNSNNFLSDLRY